MPTTFAAFPVASLRVAWVRNWTERWIERPWFDDYDVVLASSHRSVELIEAQSTKAAHLFPLATNPTRFSRATEEQTSQDLVFAGSRWGEPRAVEDVVTALTGAGLRVRLYGKGWAEVPALAPVWGGLVPYDSLPDVYRRSHFVIDDAASSTKPYGSVNSRVFDALAAGALPLSNGALGMTELFGD